MMFFFVSIEIQLIIMMMKQKNKHKHTHTIIKHRIVQERIMNKTESNYKFNNNVNKKVENFRLS